MPPSLLGRRFYYGFAAATIACLLLGHLFLLRSLRAIEREGAERDLSIAAYALADVVERAGGEAEARRAVERFAGLHPELRGVRLVSLAESATAERLRSAVEHNRAQRGDRRAEEVARRWSEHRGDPVVSVAVPFERGGRVAGAVELESFATLEGARLFDPSISLLLLFILICFLGQRRRELAIGTSLLLCTFFLEQEQYAKREVDARREAMARQSVQALVTEGERARIVLAEIGASAAGLDPLSWDTDWRGRPSGLALSPGEPNVSKLVSLRAAGDRERLWPSLALALIGFGIVGVAGFYRTGREVPAVTERDEAMA